MGTPDFAVPALQSLIAAGHDIAAVYTQPPRPAGRGKQPRKSPVHRVAEAVGLEVCTPETFKSDQTREAFAALNADLAVVAAYGLILPQAVLDAPRLGCINLHASLLPRWRGAAPIQRAIMAGDTKTGITLMAMEAGLDTGPELMRRDVPITADDTAGSLHDRLAALGGGMIAGAVEDLAAGRLTPTPQPSDGVTYAQKIDKAEARIDWSRPAREVDRMIRALSPFPGAWFEQDGQRVKVLMSTLSPGTGVPGQVLEGDLTIACGEGAVLLVQVQPAGKKPMSAADFLRGHPLRPGITL